MSTRYQTKGNQENCAIYKLSLKSKIRTLVNILSSQSSYCKVQNFPVQRMASAFLLLSLFCQELKRLSYITALQARYHFLHYTENNFLLTFLLLELNNEIKYKNVTYLRGTMVWSVTKALTRELGVFFSFHDINIGCPTYIKSKF